MKKVYVYKFVPMNEIRIHTVTSEKEFQDICNTVHNEPDTYKIIYKFDVDDEWENVATKIMYTLNRIFEEIGSVIRFDGVYKNHRGSAIKPFIYTTTDNVFIEAIAFNNAFHTYVKSILSNLGADMVSYKSCYDDIEDTIIFRRKEDVKTNTV